MPTPPDDRSRCLNVFEGPSAVRHFLDPDRSPMIPLVELPESLNPFHKDQVRIFAKCAYLLPLLNIKSLPTLSMLMTASADERLKGVHTVVENSSGNTAFSLAILASLFGVPKTRAYVPFDIAPGKLELLRLAGVSPHFKGAAADELSGIEEARQRGRQEGFFNPAQYENEANPSAHERWIAPQIWEQTGGKLTVFAAGLGTTGTLVGASRFFRKYGPQVAMVATICAPGNAVPGVRSEAKLGEIRFDWRAAADAVVEVTTKDSFRASLRLARSGILAGPSSGFALTGLLEFLRDAESRNRLRNENGEVVAAFVCGDTPLPYLDKYSTHLEPEDF